MSSSSSGGSGSRSSTLGSSDAPPYAVALGGVGVLVLVGVVFLVSQLRWRRKLARAALIDPLERVRLLQQRMRIDPPHHYDHARTLATAAQPPPPRHDARGHMRVAIMGVEMHGKTSCCHGLSGDPNWTPLSQRRGTSCHIGGVRCWLSDWSSRGDVLAHAKQHTPVPAALALAERQHAIVWMMDWSIARTPDARLHAVDALHRSLALLRPTMPCLIYVTPVRGASPHAIPFSDSDIPHSSSSSSSSREEKESKSDDADGPVQMARLAHELRLDELRGAVVHCGLVRALLVDGPNTAATVAAPTQVTAIATASAALATVPVAVQRPLSSSSLALGSIRASAATRAASCASESTVLHYPAPLADLIVSYVHCAHVSDHVKCVYRPHLLLLCRPNIARLTWHGMRLLAHHQAATSTRHTASHAELDDEQQPPSSPSSPRLSLPRQSGARMRVPMLPGGTPKDEQDEKTVPHDATVATVPGTRVSTGAGATAAAATLPFDHDHPLIELVRRAAIYF